MTGALTTNMFRTAALLTLFAVTCTALVSFTFEQTRDKIADSERSALLRSLHSVVKPERHDNDVFSDVIEVTSREYLGSHKPVPVYRARNNGKPVAAIITPVAPNGYNGNIKLIIGINLDGSLSGVRVLSHRETPGLGDAIEERRSDWIFSFDGLSLDNPDPKGWKVKRDGGQFDQMTGATITPRAIVDAVHKALLYFADHRDTLFAPPVKQPQTTTSAEPDSGQHNG